MSVRTRVGVFECWIRMLGLECTAWYSFEGNVTYCRWMECGLLVFGLGLVSHAYQLNQSKYQLNHLWKVIVESSTRCLWCGEFCFEEGMWSSWVLSKCDRAAKNPWKSYLHNYWIKWRSWLMRCHICVNYQMAHWDSCRSRPYLYDAGWIECRATESALPQVMLMWWQICCLLGKSPSALRPTISAAADNMCSPSWPRIR